MTEIPGDDELDRLLDAAEHRDNPLRPLLAALVERDREQRARLERLLRISDCSYGMALSQTQSLLQQYDRQLRRLEKITRISDRYQRNLLELNDRLRQAALKDPLTGLANRRLLMERLREEQERCQRGQAPFSLAMLDVDYFKRINDRHGHDVGDRVLCLLAQTIDEQLRGYDLCARWGGEEFMLLLPGTDIAQARRLSERIMARVRELRLPDLGQHARLTVSVGLAIHRSGEAVDQTIGRADSELLQAKRQGRDRLMVATL